MARSWYYGPRRVPQAFPPSHLRRRVRPLVPKMAADLAVSAVGGLPLLPEDLRDHARRRAEEIGAGVLEDSQRIFFDEPGLDTLLIRAVAGFSRRVTGAGRAYLRARVDLGLDRHGRAAAMLPLVPRRGYDSLMTTVLAVGTALGRFVGGPVHARAFYDSGIESAGAPSSTDADPATQGAPPPPAGPNLPLPEGHPTPAVRRYDAPRSLGDMAADIDDLYFAAAFGQAVKVTRVGPSARDVPQPGRGRRWLISITGTDHWDLGSTPNPADFESNVREVLNVPSAVRVGVVRVLHEAMRADGVPRGQWAEEPVLAVGHSQGGMVATALAAADPREVGVDVEGVLTMGTPSRRLRVRDDVVMLAVAHDQDVVPAIDGTPAIAPDQRVMVGRRLVRPRQGPLYYAHSSATYTETVRQIERRSSVAPWGRVDQAVVRLQAYLPAAGDPVRVMVFDVWQDLLEPRSGSTWQRYVDLDRPDWEPADFAEDWAPNPLIPGVPADLGLPRVGAVLEEWQQAVEGAVNGAVTGVTEAVTEAVSEVAQFVQAHVGAQGAEGTPGDEGGSGGPCGSAAPGGGDAEDDQGRDDHVLAGEER